MKRQATLPTIAFILLLMACGAHLKRSSSSVPGPASSEVAAERPSLMEPRAGTTLSFEDAIAWFVERLLSTVTGGDDPDITAHASNPEFGQGPERTGSSTDRSSRHDPYRLLARGQFRAPALPRGSDGLRGGTN